MFSHNGGWRKHDSAGQFAVLYTHWNPLSCFTSNSCFYFMFEDYTKRTCAIRKVIWIRPNTTTPSIVSYLVMLTMVRVCSCCSKYVIFNKNCLNKFLAGCKYKYFVWFYANTMLEIYIIKRLGSSDLASNNLIRWQKIPN